MLPFCYVNCLLIGSFCLIPLFRGMGKETLIINLLNLRKISDSKFNLASPDDRIQKEK